ncbi:43_t:CDS:10, partial [Acaulospora colombiana]
MPSVTGKERDATREYNHLHRSHCSQVIDTNLISDSMDARTLVNQFNVDGTTTIEKCTAICFEKSFQYAGVEYGGDADCSNSIAGTGKSVTDGCTMPCSGDSTQICGGGNRINIYEYSGNNMTPSASAPQNVGDWASQGCQMTINKCVNKCFEGGYKYAGLEYANVDTPISLMVSADCSNTVGGSLAQDGCTTPCEGDSSQLCGGGNRLTVYQYMNNDLPTAATLLESYGEWQDQSGARALPTTIGLAQMTVEKCIDACKADGFTVAGLEYASWTVDVAHEYADCGNALPSQAATEGCAMACRGNRNEICGGSTQTAWSIWSRKVTGRVYPAPSPGDVYTYQGCYGDSGNYILPLTDDNSVHHMTLDKCTTACRARGLPVALLGQENYGLNGVVDVRTACACGDKMPFAAKKSDESKCTKVRVYLFPPVGWLWIAHAVSSDLALRRWSTLWGVPLFRYILIQVPTSLDNWREILPLSLKLK